MSNTKNSQSDSIKEKFNIKINTFTTEISERFEDLKIYLDKHPNAFNLQYSKEHGYCLMIDLDLLKPL